MPLLNVDARQEDTSDWLLTDKVSSWPGTPADRGWRYLRQSLQQHDNAGTDHKYTKAILETMLSADRSSSPPPWIIQILEVRFDTC
jgi:nuclear pore complex protein Nup160